MPFTDDDIHKYKDFIEKNWPANEVLKMKALLARLSAAEMARTQHADTYCGCSKCAAWRKSAGREGR